MRSLFFLLLVLLSLSAWGQVSAKKRVAVFDFEYAVAQTTLSSPMFKMELPNVGKAAADLLIAKLVQDGNVTVIERTAIDKLIAEQNLTNSDRTDPLTAAKIGKLLGVDAIILGSVTHFDYVDKTSGKKTKHDISGNVAIIARLVNPDTAEVWAAPEAKGEVAHKVVKGSLGDRGSDLFMGGGSANPLLTECMDKAIAQLSAELEQEFPKLPKRTLTIEGLVADASETGKLVLNVGARQGIRVGDHLQVLRAGKEIRDPETGKLLLRDDTLLGEAVVTRVNDNSSIAQYQGSEPAKVSDLVKGGPK